MTKTENPLFDKQRENVGAVTFSKYSYQYHWALFRILQEHVDGNEYAIFVELHEDVVLSDSLSSDVASFEFNQVKTNKGSFTTNKLIKLKDGKSVLGKLLSSATDKKFTEKLLEVNLVSVNGFNLSLKENGLTLKKICITELDDITTQKLSAAIKKEISLSPLPTNLHFIVSELPDKKFQEVVIAEIGKLIDKLFEGSRCNSIEIYRALYDEISRKGMISHDIKDWDSLLKTKALTSTTVTRVINSFTSFKDEGYIFTKYSEIAKELGLKSIKTLALKKDFDRYRHRKIGNKSTLQIDTTKEITRLITGCIEKGEENFQSMIDFVSHNLNTNVKSQFTTPSELSAAIVCEFIMMD